MVEIRNFTGRIEWKGSLMVLFPNYYSKFPFSKKYLNTNVIAL